MQADEPEASRAMRHEEGDEPNAAAGANDAHRLLQEVRRARVLAAVQVAGVLDGVRWVDQDARELAVREHRHLATVGDDVGLALRVEIYPDPPLDVTGGEGARAAVPDLGGRDGEHPECVVEEAARV